MIAFAKYLSFFFIPTAAKPTTTGAATEVT
jgi:hypothetical protein